MHKYDNVLQNFPLHIYLLNDFLKRKEKIMSRGSLSGSRGDHCLLRTQTNESRIQTGDLNELVRTLCYAGQSRVPSSNKKG